MTNDQREPAPPRPSFDEFYIGYAPPMPPHIARFVKRAVLTIAAGVPLAASLIAIGHVRLDGGTFDYGRPRTLTGVISVHPYPSIRFDAGSDTGTDAGIDARDDAGTGGSRRALLVAPGKHGAGALMAPFDGQRVTLEATRIQRGTAVMFEVTPGSITAGRAASANRAASASRADFANRAGHVDHADHADHADDADHLATVDLTDDVRRRGHARHHVTAVPHSSRD